MTIFRKELSQNSKGRITGSVSDPVTLSQNESFRREK